MSNPERVQDHRFCLAFVASLSVNKPKTMSASQAAAAQASEPAPPPPEFAWPKNERSKGPRKAPSVATARNGSSSGAGDAHRISTVAPVEYQPESHVQTGRPRFPRFHDLVGQTPLVDLTHLLRAVGGQNNAGSGSGSDEHSSNATGVQVLAKVEWLNPSLSIKDRIVREIFDDAEARGALKPGGTVVAASSGNTAAAVAMLAAARGYRAVIVTSSKCSKEKMDAIRAYGADLRVDDGNYMAAADALARAHPGWFNVSQYKNPLNPRAHYSTLGPEIWQQTGGQTTHFVCGGSTGGTISGAGRFLKEASGGAVRVVLADPVGSVFTHYHRTFDAARNTGELVKKGKFLVEGVGKGSIPGAIDFRVIDDVLPVADREAFAMCRRLARSEGILAGGSAGMNVHAALRVAAKLAADGRPATVVTVMPDCGIKYLSKVYNDDWLAENGLLLDE